MNSALSTTASWMCRLGSWASSASGAASSNPMKASTLKTDAAKTPEKPRKPGLFAKWVVNTCAVLWLPALTINVIARARMTPISKTPRIRPARVEALTPK